MQGLIEELLGLFRELFGTFTELMEFYDKFIIGPTKVLNFFLNVCYNVFMKGEKRVLKKYYLGLFAIISLFIFNINTQAKEIYYTNKNEVTFTKEEYDFLSFMYWEGSQELMNQDDYQRFIASNIINGEISYDEYEIPTYTRALDTEDNDKKLKIVSSCNSDCQISVTATWKREPAIRSYEVVGAYLENITLKNGPITTVTDSSNISTNSNEIKKFNNGFGVSIGLPRFGQRLVINQRFTTTKSGSINASYQHAKQTISLANSKNYTISKYGYGGVFNFTGAASNVYDGMQGVNVNI